MQSNEAQRSAAMNKANNIAEQNTATVNHSGHHIVMRYANPTRLHIEPYGTIWIADSTSSIHMQMSQDETFPSWKRLGTVLEEALSALILDERFIETLIELHQKNTQQKDMVQALLHIMRG